MSTVAEALREAARRLEGVSDTARLDAEVLMAHALLISRSDLLLRHQHATAPAEFSGLVARRAALEPVAYITGRQEFYGREFAVGPAVLIPRPDSETTLQAALEDAPAVRRVLDCGVGSGALLLSFLAERPDAEGVGIDCSPDALSVAQDNAERLGVAERCRFIKRDWRDQRWAADLGQFDLILANPPYVEEGAALAPSVRDFEPHGALFAGPEGLDDYRILIPRLRGLLAANGVAVVEIGAAQADAVSEIARRSNLLVTLRHDLAGRPRALVLK